MDSRLERYLAQVDAGLRTLPEARRADELREIRQHVMAEIDARLEVGDSEDVAVEAALARFGDPAVVARGLERAHRRAELRSLPGALIGTAACAYGATWMFGVGMFLALFRGERSGVYPRWSHVRSAPEMLTAIVAGAIVVCFGAGWLSGAVFPRRAAVGTAFAYFCCYAWTMASSYLQPPIGLNFLSRWFLWRSACWLAAGFVAAIGAACGARCRRNWQSRRRSRASPRMA